MPSSAVQQQNAGTPSTHAVLEPHPTTPTADQAALDLSIERAVQERAAKMDGYTAAVTILRAHLLGVFEVGSLVKHKSGTTGTMRSYKTLKPAVSGQGEHWSQAILVPDESEFSNGPNSTIGDAFATELPITDKYIVYQKVVGQDGVTRRKAYVHGVSWH